MFEDALLFVVKLFFWMAALLSLQSDNPTTTVFLIGTVLILQVFSLNMRASSVKDELSDMQKTLGRIEAQGAQRPIPVPVPTRTIVQQVPAPPKREPVERPKREEPPQPEEPQKRTSSRKPASTRRTASSRTRRRRRRES
jgi:hypothetical protein